MKKKISIFIVLVLLTLFIYNQHNNAKRCSLCNSPPFHEPCMINLSSGDIIPMTVYDPHPLILGELADAQSSGYSSIVLRPNYFGYRDTNTHQAVCKVHVYGAVPHRRAFCRSCRKELDAFSQTGFVIADLQNPQTPVFYPLKDKNTFTLRCYTISTSLDAKEKEYRISLQGTLDHFE